MHAKRYFAALLALSFILAALSGCTKPAQTEPEPAPAAPEAAEPVPEPEEAETAPAADADAQTETDTDAVDESIPIARLVGSYVSMKGDTTAFAYGQLIRRPEESVRYVLSSLLDCAPSELDYGLESSERESLLLRLLRDILADEPFSWDGSDSVAVQYTVTRLLMYLSGRWQADGAAWFAENAPLLGAAADTARERPALRLYMTPCAADTDGAAVTADRLPDAGVVENAKRVFAAALSGDAETLRQMGFDGLPEGWSADTSGEWVLRQDADASVMLRFSSGGQLRYLPSAREQQSHLAGFGCLELSSDGGTLTLESSGYDRGVFVTGDVTTPVNDAELRLENGVELDMSYDTVLALLGEEARVPADLSIRLEAKGVDYTFYADSDWVPRLHGIYFRFAEDTFLNKTAELPAARGIRLGDSIESVFDRLPTVDRELRQWALQDIYYPDADGNYADMQYVADSFYCLHIFTPTQMLEIVFAHADNTVKWMDMSLR